MRLISGVRLLVALVVVGWVQVGFAEDYYWVFSGQEERYPSAQSACSSPQFGNDYRPLSTTFSSDVVAICRYSHSLDSSVVVTKSVQRYGDSCPPGSELDPVTRKCEPPPPDCSTASPGIFKSPPAGVINSNGANYVATSSPGTVCYNQCSYLTSDRASSCFLTPGSKTEGYCNYIGNATGENCKEPDYTLGAPGDPLNPPDTPDVPPSDPNDPGCPPGYGWSGTTCVKNPTDDGGNGPGDGDGDGDGDSGGGGSGGGDGNGGDGGDGGDGGSGNGGDGDGNGTGGDGDGNGGGDGNGDGDGEGQCDPAKDPNKCGQSSVGGEACNVDLKCEGDAIQCAILRKNKEQVCQWTYDANVKKQIADEMAGEAYQLKESSIPVSGLFTEALNKGRWLPQSCPPPQSVSVMGRTYSISWEPLCRFATAMGPIVVALASIFFAVFIGRGLKGS
ncbi:virulence factor TspB C-terminal domain-related protein [Pseudomonas sp. AG1028]|uniref:virulence factor TspB C-terminal domain-related protein n=1 Tax=Pseudomonas sp. AG1028 TaxID=2572911 RepID=UPI0015B5313E|nr:virulence factor TspB C-terminal domain-related protein [Pseudomonas sp. AG1028]